MKHSLIIALLLVAGCKMETADTALRTKLKAASDRAAAHADSVTGLSISTTDSTTNKGR